MKIAVINFSGNVGKSTVARHLLAPRLEDAEVIAIESINSDGMETAALRGNQFDELQDQLMTLGNAVVDIGASNAEDFVNLMQNYDGSHEDFDLFVVPTVPAMKQQVDTIATLRSLSEDIGVPASRLRVVFNMVDPRRDLEKLFAKVFEAHEDDRGFMLCTDAVIYQNPIFEKIKGFDRSIIELRNDPTDYVAMNADAIVQGNHSAMTTLPSSIRRRPVSRWNSADIDIPAMRLLVWIGLFNIMLSVFDGKAMQQRRTKSCSRDR